MFPPNIFLQTVEYILTKKEMETVYLFLNKNPPKK